LLKFLFARGENGTARWLGTGPTMSGDINNQTELRQRARQGDAQALQQLLEPHRDRLRKMVRLRLDRRLRGRFSSSTILEEVAREAGRRLPEFPSRAEETFFLWLRKLTGEVIQALHRQHLGSGDAGQEVSLYRGAMPEMNSVSLAAQLLGHITQAGQAAARAEMQIRLQDTLNSLDPLDREILALCHFEDLSNAEAAGVLGVDKATATRHYVRAFKRLKEILNSIPGFLGSPNA
jgi:RNA polymerase sigma-70 factor (ECF subfamily)